MSGKRLTWSVVDRPELAALLEQSDVKSSHALDGVSLYHCRGSDGAHDHGPRDTIAISLPGGACILVTLPDTHGSRPERRKKSKGE